MNILNYLEPSFEDFVDAPVGTDQLAHNSGAAPGVDAPAASNEPQADSLEIPESVGPVVIASSDEVQAATIVEDPGHTEAAQMAAAASDANTAVIEQAEVAPGEPTPAGTEEPEAVGNVSETGDEGLGGDEGAGVDALGDGSGDDLGDDLAGSDETGDLGGDGDQVGGDDIPAEDGLGDDTGADELSDPSDESAGGEEGSDGLGDDTGGDTETGEDETDGDDTEAGGPEGEAESEGEETGEAEGEETETGSESDDDDDGVEYDVPDVDTEVTDDDVADAEDDAEEAAAEDEELDDEIVDTTKSVSELEDEEASVEEFIGVLAHGIRSKKFSAQTVHLAQSKLTRLANTFGANAPVIPSMEDYNSKNLDAYYTNSLESFSGFLKRIRHARKNFFDNFAKKMNDKIHLKAVEVEIDALNKVCDQQIVRLKALEMPEAITVKVPGSIRHPDGVIKGMTSELQFMNDIAGVFKIDHTYIKGLSDILKKAIAEGDSTKAAELANKALKLALPGKKYPAAAFTGSTYLGEYKFDKLTGKATGNMVEDMKTLSERAVPELGGSVVSTGKGAESGTFKKAELIKMLQLCKVLIGLSRGTAGSTGKDIVDQLDIANRASSEKDLADKKTGEAEEQRRGEAALTQLTTQFWYTISRSLDNYSGFQYHLIGMIDGMLRIVQRAK